MAKKPLAPTPRRIASLGQVPVTRVMSPHLVCVEADLDLDTLAREMLDRSISGCPVVDDAGGAVGFVSKTDIVAARVPGLHRRRPARAARVGGRRRTSGETKVRDIMTPVLFSVKASDSLETAVALFARSGVHHLVVSGRARKIVGVLSTMDVVRFLANR